MSQNRRRWFISGLLLLAVFAFVGFSFFPVLSEALKQNQPSANKTETPAQAAVTNLQQELEARAKGYEVVLQREPNNPTALNEYVTIQLQLGQLYVQQQRYEDAIAVFDKTISTNKQDFRPVLAKGIVRQLEGKTQEAKSLYATALDIAPAEEKEQLKAEIQQLETKMAAPPANSPNQPKASNSEAKPTAPTAPESNSEPSNGETNPAASPTPASSPAQN